jgi:predicted DNA-binding transcriptional regulator AlpA
MIDDQPVLTAEKAAQKVGLCLSAFWRAVRGRRMPQPVYPLPRAPRWYPSELDAAMELTRAMPHEQQQARRVARVAARLAQASADQPLNT